MSVIGSNILAGASGQGGAYNLTNSLRFRSSASAYLNRTPASAGNQKTWTHSVWVKRGKLGASQRLLALNGGNDATYMEYGFSAQDDLAFGSYNTNFRITSQVFRDPSAWYHIVLAFDTTQATAANRVKLYVNGVEVTAFGTNNAPVQNQDYAMNLNALTYIGTSNGSVSLVDGYLAEVNFIDGVQLTPSSFGTTDAYGIWQPIPYTGTYGTNGFYLKFTDNSALTTSSNVGLGRDFSGNGNYWVTNNISITAGSTYDSMKDVPTLTSATTANYCVLNPLITGNIAATSNANLGITLNASSNAYFASSGTIPVSSGKWYWENRVTTVETSGGEWLQFGILNSTTTYTNNGIGQSGNMSSAYAYFNNGAKAGNGTFTSGYGSTFTNGDVIGVAFDADAGTITFYKNGVSQGQAFSGISNSIAWIPVVQFYRSASVTQVVSINFGQQPFAYTPPSGFVALNTFNLPTPTIGATASTTANKYMDATTYSGNGGTQSITSLGFQPDLVWVKRRNAVASHNLVDAVRGASKILYSDATTAEITDTNDINAFNSNGWTMGLNTDVNASGGTYVGWTWRGANGTVTNTAGSITSTVSANTTAGFSIVTYTGNGTAGSTVGHGLGVAPKMYIVKNRNSGGTYWGVYHTSIPASQAVYLNVNSAASTNTALWNSTAPTSSVFSVGTSSDSNESGWTYVAYCFAQVAGYSAFGSYTGNGSADGPFVYTGFRPRFILFKATSNVADWGIYDTSRSTYNVVNSQLDPNGSSAEYTAARDTDILSNGFKIRNSNGGMNTNGNTYIYMAFAEVPTKFSLAR